jgi:hypothetical protein
MNKFWKWMEEKGYGDSHRLLYDCNKVNQPKQMLVGYMIEYLFDNEKYIYNTCCKTIEEMYDFYLNEINNL